MSLIPITIIMGSFLRNESENDFTNSDLAKDVGLKVNGVTIKQKPRNYVPVASLDTKRHPLVQTNRSLFRLPLPQQGQTTLKACQLDSLAFD